MGGVAGRRFGTRKGLFAVALVPIVLWAGGCHDARDIVDGLFGDGRPHGGGGTGGAAGAGGGSDGGTGGSCGTPGTACTVPGCGRGGDLPPGFSLTDVWIGPAGEVWAVGAGGYVGRRAPETGAWCWCAPLPAETMTGVWGAASDNVFAVNRGGDILRFDGSRWLSYHPTPTGMNDVHGNGPNNVWGVGNGGWTARFNGTTWESDIVETHYTLNGVYVDPAGVVRVVGTAPLPAGEPGVDPTVEALIVRHDSLGPPGDWTLEATFQQDGAASFHGISGSSATDIWAVGNNIPRGAATSAWGFIARSNGSGWTALNLPEDLALARIYGDVAPASADGGAAWFLNGWEGVRFDGSTFVTSSALANTAAIDTRNGTMYAVGVNGLVMRWTSGSGWIVDREPVAPPAAPAP
jgi:hypothetical protein